MKKHIHFIGICGVGMGALAILWRKYGWKVTGSDVGFYPPISTHLKKHNIEFYSGWHPEKIGATNSHHPLAPSSGRMGEIVPDLVVVGNVASSYNPELKFVLENNIPHLSYPELIEQNLIKTTSIVCAGTFGKTSTTAILAKIFIDAGLNPAYMFGAVAQDLEMSADDLGGEYSIIEGDEYKTGRDHPEAKFFHYHPTHLLLTSAVWDHADVYPTQAQYLEAFKKLAKQIPANRLAVVSEKVDGSIKAHFKCPVIKYGQSSDCDYQYFDVVQTKTELYFKIKHRSEIYNLQSEIIGAYMADNICGAFALSEQLGIKPEQIIESVKNFHGIKRRLEKRGTTASGATVYDDIAHSPTKANAVLATLRQVYDRDPDFHRDDKRSKIIAVFEPNTGNRQPQSAPSYTNAFLDATEVIIPRLTQIKSNEQSRHWNGAELTKIISATQARTKYIDDDAKLVQYIRDNVGADDCVVFLGSHGFRGMIEELLN